MSKAEQFILRLNVMARAGHAAGQAMPAATPYGYERRGNWYTLKVPRYPGEGNRRARRAAKAQRKGGRE